MNKKRKEKRKQGLSCLRFQSFQWSWRCCLVAVSITALTPRHTVCLRSISLVVHRRRACVTCLFNFFLVNMYRQYFVLKEDIVFLHQQSLFPYPHTMTSMYQEMYCLGINYTLTLTSRCLALVVLCLQMRRHYIYHSCFNFRAFYQFIKHQGLLQSLSLIWS